MTGMADLEARAAAVVAKWEHGSDEHREWLRSVAVPDLVAFAKNVREGALREACDIRPVGEFVDAGGWYAGYNAGVDAKTDAIAKLISSPPSAPPADITRALAAKEAVTEKGT